MGADKATSYEHALRLRAELLSNSPTACVARELWSSSAGTYSAYRELILARKQQAAVLQQASALAYGAASGTASMAGPLGGGGGRPVGALSHSLPATVKYSFEGVKHVLADSGAAVSVVAFAALRNDLLAFGCVDGEVWVVGLPATATSQTPPACTKTRRMHSQAVQALDWAYDNTQLLSVGHDGSLCVWDTADPAVPAIRTVSQPTTAFLCSRFHRVNFSLAMVGTSSGSLEIFNCSTGMLHSRYKLPPAGPGQVQVTALDSSNHHVFLGDSCGQLHMYSCELQGRQLSRLRPTGRLRLGTAAGGQPPAAVTALQYVSFCHATDSPVLMAALRDGAICIVKANETRHTSELHLRRQVTPPSPAAMAPYTPGAPTPSASTRGDPTTPSSATAAAISSSFSRSFSSASSSGAPPSSPAPAFTSAAASAAALTTLLRLSPAICPLSVIHDVPLITYGSDDTSVYIVDVTARSFGSGPGRSGAAGGGGGGGGGGSGVSDRPLTVTVLKAHRAPVTCVSWSYDEALLASADADGMVVIWQRCRLF